MRPIYDAVLLAVIPLAPLLSIAAASSPFSGRWDLTILTSTSANSFAYLSCMEFADEDGTPAVRIVGRAGSVHPVQNAKVDGSKLIWIHSSRHRS